MLNICCFFLFHYYFPTPLRHLQTFNMDYSVYENSPTPLKRTFSQSVESRIFVPKCSPSKTSQFREARCRRPDNTSGSVSFFACIYKRCDVAIDDAVFYAGFHLKAYVFPVPRKDKKIRWADMRIPDRQTDRSYKGQLT